VIQWFKNSSILVMHHHFYSHIIMFCGNGNIHTRGSCKNHQFTSGAQPPSDFVDANCDSDTESPSEAPRLYYEHIGPAD